MAVIQLTPRDETFARVRALTGIARLILDVRLVSGLLVVVWLGLRPDATGELVTVCFLMAWMLLLLVRWQSVGWVLCTHPVILALDASFCFMVLAMTSAMSPVLLLLATGAMLTGLCLDRRGALYFSPLYAAAWWLAYSTQTPSRIEPADVFTHLVVVPVLLVAALFLGVGIRAVMLRAAATEQRLRSEMRSAGVAEERARLAREMHDSLTKSLHGVALLADALPGWVEKSPERAKAQARQVSDLIGGAVGESRELILSMRRADATSTTGDQVRSAVHRWRKTSGRDADVEISGDPELSTESAYELVAILNEALENVRRHTPPDAAVQVRLAEEHSWVVLEVADQGRGVHVVEDAGAEGHHFGMLGMRERAARVGGQLSITSRPGHGTTVSARVPAALVEEESVADLLGPLT